MLYFHYLFKYIFNIFKYMDIINISLYTYSTNVMSNIFKTNSRFAALADDIPAKKDKKENKKQINDVKKEVVEEKINSFKSDKNSFKNDGFRERRYNRYPSEQERQRILEEHRAEEEARKELEKQEAERKKQKALTPDNFPDLVLTKKEIIVIPQEQNYLEKLKKVEEVSEKHEVDKDLENLKPGWVVFKKDKSTGKTIVKGSVSVFKQPEILEETAVKIVDALVELHQRRTQEFIELNGYDTWEKMFKFPGWREWEAEFEDDSDEEYEDESEVSEEEYM